MAIITDGARTKFTDDTGLPLIGGQVFSYVEGTSTPKDTYQDRAFTIPNTNPIILDDVGSCEMFLKGGYRLRVLTADGVLVEEKDNAFQSDGQVLDVVANTTAIAALQTNVDVLNTRGGLKTDENNHVIGQGKAESATVYDLSLRSDKVRVSAPTDVEFGKLIFKTYAAPTTVNGVIIPTGTWLNPELLPPVLSSSASNLADYNAPNMTPPFSDGGFKGLQYQHATTVNGFATGRNCSVISYSPTRDESELVQTDAGGRLVIFKKSMAIQDVVATTGGKYNYGTFAIFYTTANTTKDSNGFLKGASPIVKVFADKVELNDDAVNQNVTYKKNGVGDYTITTASGLSTDGWYIELPKDINGNPKVAVGTLDDKDGVITLKTYKRMFNMETFTFEPDLDSPLDIPDGRWIDLRLNEIPVEPTH